MVNSDLIPIIGFRSYRIFSCNVSANFWRMHGEGVNKCWLERKSAPAFCLQFSRVRTYEAPVVV